MSVKFILVLMFLTEITKKTYLCTYGKFKYLEYQKPKLNILDNSVKLIDLKKRTFYGMKLKLFKMLQIICLFL